ncbi:transcriptional regulator, Crp/Fnr family [Rhizobiales bacterium GAS188]|nr:transcriptional regulator, Crp/Fnr family [Rhizobiales bacterium GAS188]
MNIVRQDAASQQDAASRHDAGGRNGANRRNQLLQSLLPGDFALLAPHLRDISLRQGEILIEPGDPVEHVYFPHTAVIVLLAVMRDGRMVETATIGRSGVIGGIAGFGQWRAFARVIVQMSGTAARIPSSRFRGAIRHSDRLTAVVLRCAQSIVVQIQQTAACNALHSAEQRLCRWLLLTQDYADTNVIPLTQELLGQMLGVRRTTITAAVSRLQSSGVIRYNRRGRIEIVDRIALEHAACECYEVLRSRDSERSPHDARRA